MSDLTDFFVVGGTLRLSSESYVVRPADEELFKHAQAGEFCYVLTPRQMGKSSLMLRTARRLQQTDGQTALIDLTGIGTEGITVEAWYQALLAELKSELCLKVEVAEWWTARQGSLTQRFIEFLHDVLLAQVSAPVTIFIDEIDSTLGLKFSDDFFAAIRFMYNERASDPVYKRLTFVLLGVATPDDLIKDRNRTPFNIGRRIVLQEFSRADAQVLADGLEQRFSGQGATILDWILHWTNGHPYLTQKLCLAAVAEPVTSWDAARVDELVKTNFFTDEARNDTNLKFVQNSIQSRSLPERRRILELYRQVYSGKSVPADEHLRVQNYLALFGLVRTKKGRLRVRNEIYRRVFDQAWIEANVPAQRQQSLAIFAGIIAAIFLAFAVYFIYTAATQTPANVQAEICAKDFEKAISDAVRLADLACLFRLGAGYDEQARRLFYKRPPAGDKNLFLDPQITGADLVTVVRGVYISLDQLNNNYDETLMDAMLQALRELPSTTETAALIEEISDWKRGRELAGQQQYTQAVISYTIAIEINKTNLHPVVHYDRAMAYIQLQQYDQALTDLERVVIIARMAPPTPTPTPMVQPSPTATPTPTITPTPSPTLPNVANLPTLMTGKPISTSTETPSSPTPTPKPMLSSDLAASQSFINSDQIIETVGETIYQNEELQSYLIEHPTDFPQLNQLFGTRVKVTVEARLTLTAVILITMQAQATTQVATAIAQLTPTSLPIIPTPTDTPTFTPTDTPTAMGTPTDTPSPVPPPTPTITSIPPTDTPIPIRDAPVLLDPPPNASQYRNRIDLSWGWVGTLGLNDYFQVEIRNRANADHPVIDESDPPIDVAWVKDKFYKYDKVPVGQSIANGKTLDREFTWRIIVVRGIPPRKKDWAVNDPNLQVWEPPPADQVEQISQPSEMRTLYIEPDNKSTSGPPPLGTPTPRFQ